MAAIPRGQNRVRIRRGKFRRMGSREGAVCAPVVPTPCLHLRCPRFLHEAANRRETHRKCESRTATAACASIRVEATNPRSGPARLC